jgi:hypothetical protein
MSKQITLKTISLLIDSMQTAETSADYKTFYKLWAMLKLEMAKLERRKQYENIQVQSIIL